MASSRWPIVAEAIGLAFALALVFVTAYLPHLDTFTQPPATGAQVVRLAEASWGVANGTRTVYHHTMHVDENIHWSMAAGVQREGTVFVEPPSGERLQAEGFFSLGGAVHERGFHVILAEVQSLTGVPFETLFEFVPAAWLTFTAFALYALLRPSPAAVPAAAFVALIPTTARFLGPAFLVPIGFVLAWLPATLILAEPGRKRASSAALLLLVVSWSFFIHLIGGFAAVSLLAFGALFGVARERRSLLTLLAVAAVPVLWLYRAFQQDIQVELRKEETLPIDFTIFDGFGIWALALWAAGVLLVTVAPPRERSGALRGVAAFSTAVLALILSSVVFDLGRYATYARWHPPFFLAAAAPMGYAAATAGTFAARAARGLARWVPRTAHGAPGLAVLVTLAIVAGTVSPGLGHHMKEPYYHVLDDTSWEQFVHVARTVAPEYEVFLSEPWRAPILAAMTGKEPHAWLAPGAPPVNGEDYETYVATGGTLEFFVDNDITLVVGEQKPPFDEFVELGPNIWGLRPDLARGVAAIRALEGR